MSWTFLPKGVYPDGHTNAACTQCGKNAAPNGCFTTVADAYPTHVAVRSTICTECMFDLIHASKKKERAR